MPCDSASFVNGSGVVMSDTDDAQATGSEKDGRGRRTSTGSRHDDQTGNLDDLEAWVKNAMKAMNAALKTRMDVIEHDILKTEQR
ncbi:hypothetical protein CH63R_14473 [Colletotrichum higginsianum IMI 349063]|uniref:Uncharacterized protein n=1 Tax=Colletotrichum higginsianum (strain IMI 349063) TaxID=759273 RepID=A0A1B7XQX5_COLHI|nr:hypothetical protein CH63R_14473 [Colletotrichum higginsianum IMI 349063]OBR02172.1 hypothetical protein CH63R_14473 [Colletotrichum higginsianum IMI 349063]